jgi:hypothetical protein
LFPQQSALTVQELPTAPQPLTQFGAVEQFESAQSVAPSQSLSIPSLQTSVVGEQAVPRKGETEEK